MKRGRENKGERQRALREIRDSLAAQTMDAERVLQRVICDEPEMSMADLDAEMAAEERLSKIDKAEPLPVDWGEGAERNFAIQAAVTGEELQ